MIDRREPTILDPQRHKSAPGPARAPQEMMVDGALAVVEEYGGPINLAADRDPWTKQPTEPDRSWVPFTIFRDLLPGQRTLNRTHRRLLESLGRIPAGTSEEATVVAPAWMVINAKMYKWKLRASARDLYEDEVAQKALIRKRVKARVETAELGRGLRLKAAQAASVIQALTVIKQVDASGKVTRVMRSNLTIGEIAKLAQVGAALERSALGMDNTGSGPVPGLEVNINVTNVPQSDEEIIDEAAQILAARGQLIDA